MGTDDNGRVPIESFERITFFGLRLDIYLFSCRSINAM